MIYIICTLGGIFLLMGLFLNKNNSKFLLFNTKKMSREEKQEIDLSPYFPFMRIYFFGLGLFIIVNGLIFNYFVSEYSAVLFLISFTTITLLFFIWKLTSIAKRVHHRIYLATILALSFTFVLMAVIFGFGLKEDAMTFEKNAIHFDGTYGESLSNSDITSIQLVNKLPRTSYRTNGFSVGNIRKGYYKTKDGEIVKLIINKAAESYLLITKKDGSKIYYSSKRDASEDLLKKATENLNLTK